MLTLKRLHTPQHRSPQANHTLSSIMKMPKYSSQVSFNLDAELVQDNCAQSMPPLGPLPDSLGKRYPATTTSVTSSDSYNHSNASTPIHQGDDFQPIAEIYIFRFRK